MGFIAFVLILVSVALIGLGVVGVVSPVAGGICAVAGVFLLLATLFIIASTKLYRKTLASEAFVRTGKGGALVVLDGGCFVIPIWHRTVPVCLETMKLEVERKGPDALITQDNLRVDIKAEFYIKVQANRDDILDAARSLGGRSVNSQSVGDLVFEKLVSALRSVAATKALVELHTKRNEFAEAVHEIVRSDLKANGLTLEAVTISRLDQTDTELLNDSNVFDAQGKKRIAQVTQEAKVERNRIERQAEREITAKDVETRKQVLDLEKERAAAEAVQTLEVSNIRAEAKRRAQAFQIEQDQAVAERNIEKDRAVQTAQVQQDRDVQAAQVDREVLLISKAKEREVTDIERAKVVELSNRDKEIALIGKQKEKETADIGRARVVETTSREKEVAVAQKEAERAAAQALALQREAERERAAQEIMAVKVTAEAEREALKKLIAAKQLIEQDKIKEQTQADVRAYQALKLAEAEKGAASLQAEAKLKLAEADAQGAKIRAEGVKAEKMVDVDVERERVQVEQKRVEVERQSLQNKQEFSQAALEFEVQKLRVEADREARIALARAIGEFMSRGNYTVFGDPATMAAMMAQYSKGLGLATSVDGFFKSMPEEVAEIAKATASGMGGTVAGIVERLAARKGNEPHGRQEPEGQAGRES
ncbi:MAG: hypothetical protein HYU36_02130 [Planctomycetes bacterium]|nr:hypothetical protein [Planctomycetota bacterium]